MRAVEGSFILTYIQLSIYQHVNVGPFCKFDVIFYKALYYVIRKPTRSLYL